MSNALPLERDRAYRGLMDLIVSGGIDPDVPLSERKIQAKSTIPVPSFTRKFFEPRETSNYFKFMNPFVCVSELPLSGHVITTTPGSAKR